MKSLIQNKLLGGVLLISGTTLGVGMLAFPTVTSFGGFIPSVFLFIAIWLVMLATSFFFLDANLSIKGPVNMITMAEKTLGTWGKLVAWVIYLLLLYSLIAVFIAGCTPHFVDAIAFLTNYTLPSWLAPLALPILFGGFIYIGTGSVDVINRLLMFGLVVSYFLLIGFVPEQVDLERLSHIDLPAITIAIPAVVTAFGYHIIIPSLCIYMNRDRAKLRKTIIIGSFIPIFVYLLWQTLIVGAVPMGDLMDAFKEGVPATTPLAKVLSKPMISLAARYFSFFAIVTSFIGVSLSLTDFLADGFKIQKSRLGRVGAIILAFLPPLFFIYTYQRGFYLALNYAGAFVAILLIFLPAAMVWKLKNYRSVAKKIFLIFICLIAVTIVVLDVIDESGILRPLTIKYVQSSH